MPNLEPLPTSPTRIDIERLQAAMRELPQAEGLITKHYFADGMYCRELWRPAGCTIVGKVHKKEHFYFVFSGEVTVTAEGMLPERIKAPRILVCPVGTKRAVYAHVDSVCVTVHRCEARDLDAIEEDLVEPDDTALFDARNELKSLEQKR